MEETQEMDLITWLGRSPGGGHDNPLQYSCLENPHGQRSLAGFSPQGCKESDMTEWLRTARRACGILVSEPGVKTAPPALEAQSLNHWITKEVPSLSSLVEVRRSTGWDIFHLLILSSNDFLLPFPWKSPAKKSDASILIIKCLSYVFYGTSYCNLFLTYAYTSLWLKR